MSHVYVTKNGKRWHLSPLCRWLGDDWQLTDVRFLIDNGIKCCPECAEYADIGRLVSPLSGDANGSKNRAGGGQCKKKI